MAILKIRRFSRRKGEWIQEYEIESENITLLKALEIAREQDPTLAFTRGCRYKYCGLCSVMVDGRPRPACLTEFRNNMLVESLKNLDTVRDLVIDRKFIFEFLSRIEFTINSLEKDDFEPLDIPEELYMISRCNDCLCCISTCICYSGNYEPWSLVKILNLYLNPFYSTEKTGVERIIEKCSNCMKCYCVHGISLKRVIKLLSELSK